MKICESVTLTKYFFLFGLIEQTWQWRNYYGLGQGEPGAPNPNGPNGGIQDQSVEENHWSRPLICHNVVFWPSVFCKISPQSLGILQIQHYTLRFGTSTRGGAFKHFEPGGPDITLHHWNLN
jgi:hypothetical protein